MSKFQRPLSRDSLTRERSEEPRPTFNNVGYDNGEEELCTDYLSGGLPLQKLRAITDADVTSFNRNNRSL